MVSGESREGDHVVVKATEGRHDQKAGKVVYAHGLYRVVMPFYGYRDDDGSVGTPVPFDCWDNELRVAVTADHIQKMSDMIEEEQNPQGDYKIYDPYDDDDDDDFDTSEENELNESGEVRVTSSTGGQKGSKPARFDLIPADAEWALAEHYGAGAEKYEQVNGLDNWRNGYPFSLSIAAASRHLNAVKSGEDIDEETGHYHVIALAWHAFTLYHFMQRPDLRAKFDDRQDRLEAGRDGYGEALDKLRKTLHARSTPDDIYTILDREDSSDD